VRASVLVPRERAEEATARMLALFPEGFAEEPGPDCVELVAYTDESGAHRLRRSFGAVRMVPVAPGWEEEWKRFHVPVVVGSLWIGPPWEQPPGGSTPVVIDPGRAFGTGSHPTTWLCVGFLQELGRGSLLDLGCGSGVLAIAAAKLGFAPVIAVDDDEAAIHATRVNADRNGVELDVRQADALADPLPEAALVLANIDLPTLTALAPRLRCGQAVTSGYCESESIDLPGFRRLIRRTDEEWAADLFARE
jgi:ribosomal protein L11 methyltransferase